MKLYLASSWRNEYQASALADLRDFGFEVYDFKNPAPGNTGFGWSQCGVVGAINSVERLREVLAHPVAIAGFGHDFRAMQWADAGVLLLPSGMSAHLEAGWFAGAGKPVAVYAPQGIREPELMYKCFDVDGVTPLFARVTDVAAWLRRTARPIADACDHERSVDEQGTPRCIGCGLALS